MSDKQTLDTSALGQEVEFAAYDHSKKAISTGRGFVKAVHIDEQGHKAVHLKVSAGDYPVGTKINVKLAGIGADKELQDKMLRAHAGVDAIAHAGNTEVKAIVAKHDAQVDALINDVYGSPVVLPDVVASAPKALDGDTTESEAV